MNDVPLLDLGPEHALLREDLRAAFEEVMASGDFILGPNVREFEREAAVWLGATHAVGVNSGTDALVLSLRAVGIGAGDEVITTAFTFFATAESISIVGATPVFIDIDPDTFNLDLDHLEAAITPRTRAVIAVHLFGRPMDMDRLSAIAAAHSIAVIEDAAQAFGAEWRGKRVGSTGTAAAFSFFPSKNLGGFGDGGLVTTADDSLADSVRKLRAHGSTRKYHNEMLGYNSRLDELQAALLRVKLKRVEHANNERRRVASVYGELLAGIAGLAVPSDPENGRHVYHQYTVRVADGRRNDLAAALTAAGIGNAIYYPVPVHQLPVYEHHPASSVTLPSAERAAQEVLSLPIWPGLRDTDIDRVCTAVRDSLG